MFEETSVSDNAFTLLVWGPVIVGMLYFVVHAASALKPAISTSQIQSKAFHEGLQVKTLIALAVLLLTALCCTWGYMLQMVFDDMVLTGDKNVVAWFLRGARWHRPHSMIFEAYQLTSLDPTQWYITGQVLIATFFSKILFKYLTLP